MTHRDQARQSGGGPPRPAGLKTAGGGAITALALRLIRPVLLLVLVLLLPLAAEAANLTYSLPGLEGELRRNVRAWLGATPETPREREAFISLAHSRASKALQALGHYRPQIDISVERSEPIWSMVIAVDPGPTVRIAGIDIQITGAAARDEEFSRLRENPGFARGDALNHGRFDDFRRRLLNLAQTRGYFQAELTRSRVEVDAGAGTAMVRVVLDSGPRFDFGELRFDSALVNAATLDALRTFERGDPYVQNRLREFQARVQSTGFFASVLVEPVPAEARDGEVPIVLSLQPASRHSFDVGVGYSTDTEERISVTWRTPRINRFGHSQQTRLVYSRINPSGRISYNIPLTHPINDMLQLWGRTEENEFGDLESRQDELGLRRELRRGNWIFGYSLRQLTESWEVLDDSRINDYLLPGVSLSSRLHRGSLVDPEAGFNQLYTLEAAREDAGSDVDLVRVTGLLRYIYTPFAKHRMVGRTELGFADIGDEDRAQLAPSLNFFAGGSRSIRGFGYQSIGNKLKLTRRDGSERNLVVGGDRLLVLSAEYQYYFSDQWRGALFVDGGDAFDSGEFDWHYGAGFGIHYLSPVGAVRLEVANSLSEENPDWQLHLNIGAEF